MSGGGRTRSRWLASLLLASALLVGTVVQIPAATADATPGPPSSVRVSARDTIAVASWEAEHAAGFSVEIAPSPDFVVVRSVPASSALVVLDQLTPATTYYLRVVARSADGLASQPSPTVTFTTTDRGLPSPAPVLDVSSESSTSLHLTWSADAIGSSYQVQIYTANGLGKPRELTVDEREVTFDELDSSATYSVRVRVVDSTGAAASAWSEVVTRKTASSLPLNVGSYNVLKAASKKGWVKRRGAVASTILGENADVVGLQEATPVHVPGGYRQYADVARLLGSDWALTTSAGEARIVYNKARLTLIRDGYDVLEGSRTLGVQRYAPWAVFEQRSTGKRFFFMNTHFLPQEGAKAKRLRASAARQMVATVKRANTEDLPVVIVGDFNSGGLRNSANAVYRTFTGAGYIDPLVRTRKLGAAEKLIRTELKTVNKLRRTAPRDSTAPMIDHIFVSRMRVSEYEVVAKLDRSGRFVGTIPSDHNMIRATIYLP